MTIIKKQNKNQQKTYDVQSGQSIELLKELHILTRDGKLNQDSRRKLKQVYHLYQFIEPLLASDNNSSITLVDHGAGKSYLGFIIYDLFTNVAKQNGLHVYGIETRDELVAKSQQLAKLAGFTAMQFLHLSVADSISSKLLPDKVNVVTALHACNTATDDAIDFALAKDADNIVLVPCCQAEVAAVLRKNKSKLLADIELGEMWRHPIHAREFGSHITNVLRCLRLEAHGYSVTATELIGWEHSMKNELIIAKKTGRPNLKSRQYLLDILDKLGLVELKLRFNVN